MNDIKNDADLFDDAAEHGNASVVDDSTVTEFRSFLKLKVP